MASRWFDRLARIGGAVDRAFGEPVMISPLSGDQYSQPGADPDQPAFQVVAEYFPAKPKLYGGDGHALSGQHFETVVSPADGEIHIRSDRLVGRPALRRGWRVTMLDTGQTYRIGHVDKHRPNFVIVSLALEKLP